MQNSDPLFDLIKSLTKNEKGYFKKYSRINSNNLDNNYIKLFNSIEAQKEYDERLLQKKFKGEKFIKQLAVTKKYLYGLILDSIVNAQRDEKSKIKNLIAHAKILIAKQLMSQAEVVLKQAEEIAKLYEAYLHLIEIESMKSYLFKHKDAFEKFNDFIDNGYTNIKKYMLALENKFEYERIADSLYRLQGNQRYARDEKMRVQYKKFGEHPLLQNESLALSVAAKMYYYVANSYYALSTNQLEKCLMYRKQNLDFVTSLPKHFYDYFNHGACIGNLLVIYTELKQFKQAKETLLLLENFITAMATKKEAPFFTLKLQNVSVALYFAEGLFDKGIKIFEKFKQSNSLWPLSNGWVVGLYLSGAAAYFHSKKYKETTKCINDALHEEVKSYMEQDYGMFRILNLMAHYELQNFDLLESLMLSYYRFFYKRKNLFVFEEMILRNIKKLLYSKKESVHTLFNEIKKETDVLIKDANERRVIDMIKFDVWIDEKVKKFT